MAGAESGPETVESVPVRPGRGAGLSRWCRARVLGRLAALDGGQLLIRDADGEHRVGRDTGLVAEIDVHDLHFWRMMATGGSVGAAEAYMAELWDTPDLVAAIRVLAASRDAMADMEKGAARLYAGLLKIAHRMNRNSLAGSRRNIAAHYDLGNAFFAEWLDARMQYSSGIFAAPDDSLEQAQEAKLARIAERLALGPDDHLLEIGTGWGGLAIYMAETTGCRVTTTTISKEQHAHAVEAEIGRAHV